MPIHLGSHHDWPLLMAQKPPSHVNCRSTLRPKVQFTSPEDQTIFRTAGAIAASVCKAPLTMSERLDHSTKESDAALVLQVYLLCDTLGWAPERVMKHSPLLRANVLALINEVNGQRCKSRMIDCQVTEAEKMFRDIYAPMLEKL